MYVRTHVYICVHACIPTHTYIIVKCFYVCDFEVSPDLLGLVPGADKKLSQPLRVRSYFSWVYFRIFRTFLQGRSPNPQRVPLNLLSLKNVSLALRGEKKLADFLILKWRLGMFGYSQFLFFLTLIFSKSSQICPKLIFLISWSRLAGGQCDCRNPLLSINTF